jgi:ribosome-binding factor A
VTHKRVLRAAEAIGRELGFILDRKLADPRIGMVTVTRVELSDDLRYAKVFVSFLGDEEQRRESLRLLRRARKFVRAELSHAISMRVTPELTFVIDESSENYIRIASVLKTIEKERTHETSDDATEGDDSEPDDPASSA